MGCRKGQLVLALVVVGLFMLLLAVLTEAYTLKPPVELHIGQLFGSLLLIALLLERALEVFLTSLRAPASEALTEEIKVLQEAVDKTPDGAEAIELKGKQDELAKRRQATRKIALFAALIVGIAVSVSGIRTLETMVQVKAGSSFVSGLQAALFRLLDTLLTGGVIAGGSDGIHKLAEVYRAATESHTRRAKRADA